MNDDKSPALKRMMNGEAPANAAEWREMDEFMPAVAKFLGVINLEMDYIGHALDVTEPILEILADAADPATKDLLKQVVDKHEQESHGLQLPEVQDQNGGRSGPGITGAGESGDMSPEGEAL